MKKTPIPAYKKRNSPIFIGQIYLYPYEYKRFQPIKLRFPEICRLKKESQEYKELYLPKAKPPLEGFWWQDKNGVRIPGIDYSSKETFQWISLIRLPDFVTVSDFEWAKESVRQLFGIL